MNSTEESTPFTAIYKTHSEGFDDRLQQLLSHRPLLFIGAAAGAPMRRQADVFDAGTRRLRSSSGAEHEVPLVLCAYGDKEVVYRCPSIAGSLPVGGVRQCGAEVRLWQRVAQLGTNVVPCRYSAYERGRKEADDYRWFLLELPPIKMSDYLPGLSAKRIALQADDILRMLLCVVDGVRCLYSLNFIVGPRALTVDNLWIAAGSKLNVQLENGIATLADEGDRQWRDEMPLSLVARAAAEEAAGQGHDETLGEFTYLHVAYPDEVQLEQCRRLARRATCACLRQLIVLTHDLLLRRNSGLDYATACGGHEGGHGGRPLAPAEYIDARVRAATEFVQRNDEFTYPLMFMNYCRELADGGRFDGYEPELAMDSVRDQLLTMTATMRSKCPLPDGYCARNMGDRLLLIDADRMGNVGDIDVL